MFLWIESLFSVHQARRMGSSRSNNPNSQMAFKGEFSKATFDVRVAACVIRSWNFFSLAGGVRVFLAPVNLRSTHWWSAYSQLPSPSVGFCSCKTTQVQGSAGPKLVLFPFVTAVLCLFIFSFLWLNLLLGTQGRSRKRKLFYKQEVRDRKGAAVCPWEGSCWVFILMILFFCVWHQKQGQRKK